MGIKEFLITVIIPLKNAGQPLKEAINNLTKQTVGFRDNIQLILVNDGIRDESKSVCEEYKSMYPDNIVYLDSDGEGFQYAGNKALKHVCGEYTIFLDEENAWKTDAFEKIADFFGINGDAFDVCCCSMDYIDGLSHKTNSPDAMFAKGSRIADLRNEPQIICSTLANCVLRSSAVMNEQFCSLLKTGRDELLLNCILLKKPMLGILEDAVIYYGKNDSIESDSASASTEKEWYLSDPEQYYISLEDKAISMQGEVPLFIQYAILHDIKRRFNGYDAITVLNDDEKRYYLEKIAKALRHIDVKTIYKAAGLDCYKRLYLINLKYGRDVMPHTVRKGTKFYYEGEPVLNLQSNSAFRIEAFYISGDILHAEGKIGAGIAGKAYSLSVLANDGTSYASVISKSRQPALIGFVGEAAFEGETFAVKVPVKEGQRIRFILKLDQDEVEMTPGFARHIGIDKKEKRNYCVKNGYIVKCRGKELSFTKDTKVARIRSELSLRKEHRSVKDKQWRTDRKTELKMIAAVNDKRLADRIAFVSVRSDGEPVNNLGAVYAAVNKPKTYFCSRSLNKNPQDRLKAAECIYSSKVVVTDDYMSLFRDYGKREGQYFVQLWHAAGAFKRFGADGSTLSYCIDALYHKDYDLVSVSSEWIREVYAGAFGIEKEKVKALGFPRSDRFFDEDLIRSKREYVLKRMPELEGKQVILYAPSFREKGKKRIYIPEIDYDLINGSLSDNQIMVFCPHPLTPKSSGLGDYDKIRLVRDIPTNDMMMAADLLVTDYSSVIFDYALLDKPIAFFCYDYDTYNRGLYINYDTDLPGESFKDVKELADYLKKGVFETDDRLKEFREKQLSACDGHSAERVAKAIEELLDK